jgi:hypothetical protein
MSIARLASSTGALAVNMQVVLVSDQPALYWILWLYRLWLFRTSGLSSNILKF